MSLVQVKLSTVKQKLKNSFDFNQRYTYAAEIRLGVVSYTEELYGANLWIRLRSSVVCNFSEGPSVGRIASQRQNASVVAPQVPLSI